MPQGRTIPLEQHQPITCPLNSSICWVKCIARTTINQLWLQISSTTERWELPVLASAFHLQRLLVIFMVSLKRQYYIASLTNKSMDQMPITLLNILTEEIMLEIFRTIRVTIKEVLRPGTLLPSFRISGNSSHLFNLFSRSYKGGITKPTYLSNAGNQSSHNNKSIFRKHA